MAFRLAEIKTELAAMPLQSPYALELAVAVISDVVRSAGLRPPTSDEWSELYVGKNAAPNVKVDLREEQLGMVAHFLRSPSLRGETITAIATAEQAIPAALEAFLSSIFPLTAEMIRGNVFRQEELLRRWIEIWKGTIEGEPAEQSTKRLEQLDYRTTLVEYQKAEKARASEAKLRAAALKKAEEAEAAARGWRE